MIDLDIYKKHQLYKKNTVQTAGGKLKLQIHLASSKSFPAPLLALSLFYVALSEEFKNSLFRVLSKVYCYFRRQRSLRSTPVRYNYSPRCQANGAGI